MALIYLGVSTWNRIPCCYFDRCHLPLIALDPGPARVNGPSLTSHNGGFQGRLKGGYVWWIGFLVSSLGSQTEFRLAERGNSAVISSARFVPCLQDIRVKKKEREEKNFVAFGWWEGCWAEATIWWLTCWFINLLIHLLHDLHRHHAEVASPWETLLSSPLSVRCRKRFP